MGVIVGTTTAVGLVSEADVGAAASRCVAVVQGMSHYKAGVGA